MYCAQGELGPPAARMATPGLSFEQLSLKDSPSACFTIQCRTLPSLLPSCAELALTCMALPSPLAQEGCRWAYAAAESFVNL